MQSGTSFALFWELMNLLEEPFNPALFGTITPE